MPAPTFVGAGTPAFTATSAAAIVPGLPAGWAAGDLAVLVYAKSNNDDLATPSGWTELLASSQNNTTAQRVEVFGRILQAGDTAPSLAGAANTIVRGAQIFAWRDGPTGSVAAALSASSRSNNAVNSIVTFATITPPDADTGLLAVYAFEDDPANASTMSGWSAFTVAISSLGNDMAIGYATRTWTSGATGALTTTISGTGFTPSVNVGILLAIKPLVMTIDLSGSPAGLTLSADDPTVLLPPLEVDLAAAPASVAVTAVDPTVTIASADVTVDLAALPALVALAAVDPTTVLGSLSLDLVTVAAGLSLSGADPSVRLGSLTLDLSSAAATVVLAAADPTVSVSGGGLTVDLTVLPAAVMLTGADPTVLVTGGGLSVDVAEAPALVILAGLDPTVVLSSLTLDVAAAAALVTLTAVDAGVVLGSLTLDLGGAPSALGLSVSDPTVLIVAAVHGRLRATLTAVAGPRATLTALGGARTTLAPVGGAWTVIRPVARPGAAVTASGVARATIEEG